MLEQHPTTIPTAPRDHPEWHHGRCSYAVWLVPITNGRIMEHVASAREHLSGLLLEPYLRQPHITVCVCGFLSTDTNYDDDFSEETFRRQVQAVHDAALGPFSIGIGGLNSFASAPYLEVHDRQGQLERMRAALLMNGREIGRSVFVPHVTIGLYADAFPSGVVLQRLASFPTDRFELAIEHLTFAVYQAQEPAGPLIYRQEISLRSF